MVAVTDLTTSVRAGLSGVTSSFVMEPIFTISKYADIIRLLDNLLQGHGNKDYAVSCVTNLVHYLEKLFHMLLSKCCCCRLQPEPSGLKVKLDFDLYQRRSSKL